MKTRQIRTIVQKELKDLFRDRKTWITTLFIPVLFIPLLFFIMAFTMSRANEEARNYVPISVQDEAGQVKGWLASTGNFIIKTGIPDVKKAIQEGEIRGAVLVDSHYYEKAAGKQPVSVTLLYDSADNKSQIASSLLKEQLDKMNGQLLAKRLEDLKISSEVLTPLDTKQVSVATDKQMSGSFLSLLIPLMLVMSVVSGGVPAATDIIAGEKERGTLEALLTTPVGSRSILAGKLIVVTIMGCVSAVASLTTLLFTMGKLPSLVAGDAPLSLEMPGPSVILFVFLLMILLSGMFAGLEITLSTFAKSFKEAQTYMSPLIIVAMVPAYLMMQTGAKDIPLLYFYLPIFNVISIMKELFYGVTNGGHMLTVVGTSLAYMAVAIFIASSFFRKESLIFRS
ncbi:ABC transporter permease [Aneurinibacillus tyrosinisolvens]|uniref:ABC transporter permease n=1 Tax=Aneurinibacillus tyrosinisolvens TaxID=1443435 RepID=UPI00063F5264|nr:ABC transporter permease [Aneurinibacillus tyrosinisolvens]